MPILSVMYLEVNYSILRHYSSTILYQDNNLFQVNRDSSTLKHYCSSILHHENLLYHVNRDITTLIYYCSTILCHENYLYHVNGTLTKVHKDTILKGDHLRIISAKFDFDWPGSFKRDFLMMFCRIFFF